MPKTRTEIATEILEIVPIGMGFIRFRLNGMTGGNLSVQQFRILTALQDRPLAPKEIGQWLGVRAPTVTRFLRGLMAQKLTRWVIRKADRRNKDIVITPLGRQKIQHYRGEFLKVIDNRLVNMTAADRDQLLGAITTLKLLFKVNSETAT